MRHPEWLILAGALFLLPSCASGPPEPLVPMAPSVAVSLQSTVITPDVIQFVGKVVIKNRMAGPLSIQQVDYGAALHDQPMFDETFAALHPMRNWGTQTVTLPFQIAMKDIIAQGEDVLAEEAVRVTLRGTVVPVGWQPIAFVVDKVIPLPQLPTVAFDGSSGNPLDGQFTVYLRVRNTNAFPIDCGTMATHLRLNGKRYDLLRSESFASLQPGEAGRVALTMNHTRGKGISMLVNVLKNQSAEFSVGGAMTFGTPHGVFHLPVEIAPDGVATPGR